MKSVQIRYFAILREQRGVVEETVSTSAATPRALYAELQERHHFSLPHEMLRVVVNSEFSDWDVALVGGESIVFIPPVAGG